MGLWARLWGKQPPPVATPTGPALDAVWPRWHALSASAQVAAVRAHLAGLLQGCPRLVLDARRVPGQVQVQGLVGVYPFFLTVQVADLDVELELRASNPRGVLELVWEPARGASGAVPGQRPAWDDEDDDATVFVADTVLIEGSDAWEDALTFGLLPSDLRAALVDAMGAHRLASVRMGPEAIALRLCVDEGTGSERLAPVPALLALLGKLGSALAVLPLVGDEDPAELEEAQAALDFQRGQSGAADAPVADGSPSG